MNSKTNILSWAILCVGAIVLAIGGTAQADDKKPANGWTFEASPYFWMSGIKGDVGVKGLPPSSIDVSFSDIFNHIDWPAAVMVAGEARHGRFGILGDVLYIGLTADGATSGPLFGSGTVDLNMFIGTFEGAYRVVDLPTVKVDGLAGARMFYVDANLSLSNGILPGKSGSGSTVWADPVVGLRTMVPLRSGFFLQGYGDVGGGPNGDLTWQLYGGLGYNFNNRLSANLGYRYLDIQHQDGGLVFDVSMQGPLIGMGFRF